jgi:hypothetical protein
MRAPVHRAPAAGPPPRRRLDAQPAVTVTRRQRRRARLVRDVVAVAFATALVAGGVVLTLDAVIETQARRAAAEEVIR